MGVNRYKGTCTSNAALVNKYVGTAYDHVKVVSDNIEDVKTVADALGDEFPADGLDTLVENIDDVVTVGSNIDDVVTVAGIKDEVVTVAGIEQEIIDVPSYTAQAIDAANAAEEDADRAEQAADDFEATFAAQFKYKHIGNISDHVGETLTDVDKLNAYRFPDDTGDWYGPLQSQTFPVTVPANPETDDEWVIVSPTLADSVITTEGDSVQSVLDSYDIKSVDKGEYAPDIELATKYDYVTYSGKSYFATNPPYTTTTTTPDNDTGNLFVGGYVNQGALNSQINSIYNATESFGFVDKSVTQSYVGRGYVKASPNGEDFRIGFEHARYKSTEYWMDFNLEGFLWITNGYAGDSIGTYILPDLTGSFIQSSSGNYFASAINDSFSFSFEGTGFYLNCLTDNRGGVWSFSVDGGEGIEISVWTSDVIQSNQILVTDSLSAGTHSVVATYKGADPENPPASGGANGRGWLKYDWDNLGVSTIRAIPEITGKPSDKGIELDYSSSVVKAIGSGTVLDFAIKARPASLTGLTPTWVPYHTAPVEGNAMRNIALEIIVDGLVLDNDPSPLINGLIFNDSVIIKQTYDAYNNLDATNTKLWSGVFTHKFTEGKMITDHSIKVSSNIYVESGYMAMFAVQSPNMNRVTYSSGFTYEPISDWSGNPTERRSIANLPSSVCFQNTNEDVISSFDVNLKDILTLNESNYLNADIFIESRTTDLIKCYWTSFDNVELIAGMVYRNTASYNITPDVNDIF